MEPINDSQSKALLLAVATLVLLVCVPGTVGGAASTPEVHAHPQQVSVNVSEFGGDFTLGGNVDGTAAGVGGRIGAAGAIGGNGTIGVGGTEFDVSASVDASVETGVGDVLETATAQGQVVGSVAGPGRTYDFERNATLPAFVPVPTDVHFAPQGPGSGGSQLSILTTSPGGVLRPGQATTGDWFTLSFWDLYGFLVNLLLGLVLVGVFPAFSSRVWAEASSDPSRTGLFGIAVLVAIPLVLLLFALSLFGVPLALLGGVLFVVLAWVGAIYGRFVVGAWLLEVVSRSLDYAGIERSPVENRWAALFLGLIVVALLIHVPYVGRIVDVVVVSLGVGAIGQIAYRTYRGTERTGGPDRSRVAHPDDG